MSFMQQQLVDMSRIVAAFTGSKISLVQVQGFREAISTDLCSEHNPSDGKGEVPLTVG